MKHIKLFEQFVNEGNINESKDLGNLTRAIEGGSKSAFKKLLKSAKPGDTFSYTPSGVDMDYVDRSEMNDDHIWLEDGVINRGQGTITCTIELVKKVKLTGGSFFLEGDKTDAVFFSIAGGNKDIVYVLTADPY